MEITLYNNDCLKILKTFSENSIDSIITDPPYGIKFMNKKWDYNIPSIEIWKECLRVLKPGGHILVACGTKTQHRMACNIEDAGFEIRDLIAWIYGCYSWDTEILTKRGWFYFDQLHENDEILQWDKDTNNLSWIKPLNKFKYVIDDEMVLFENRHTSQLITKNHSVYTKIRKHSRNVKSNIYEKIEAINIKKVWQIDLPLAGNLKGIKKIDHPYLIGWWLTDAWLHNDGKACMFSQSKPKTLKKLKDYFDKNNIKYSEYIKKPKKENHNIEHTFYVNDMYISDFLIKNYPNRELSYEILNWDYSSRLLLLEGLLDGDGSRGVVRGYSEVFWSKNKNRLDVFQALCLSLNIRNHINYDKGCVYLNREHNSTQLQAKHKKSLQKYKGNVWCLETYTGAFVVRRKGKAFISGNSGFPKSLNIGKATDELQGNNREFVRDGISGKTRNILNAANYPDSFGGKYIITKGNSEWEGWGTGLKPSMELFTLARKSLSEKTIAENVLKWETGGINIDECRIKTKDKLNGVGSISNDLEKGRFPANIIHDGSEEVLELFPETKSGKSNNEAEIGVEGVNLPFRRGELISRFDDGSAARFFYCPKASNSERNENLDEFEEQIIDDGRNKKIDNPYLRGGTKRRNTHPTVKPIELMKYLCRLITPKNGIILDPFMGSGSTGIAAKIENFDFIGIEIDEQYFKIARTRINNIQVNYKLI